MPSPLCQRRVRHKVQRNNQGSRAEPTRTSKLPGPKPKRFAAILPSGIRVRGLIRIEREYKLVEEKRQKHRCVCNESIVTAPSQMTKVPKGGRYDLTFA